MPAPESSSNMADTNPSASPAETPPDSVGGHEPPPYATTTTKDETTALSGSSENSSNAATTGETTLPPPVVEGPKEKTNYRSEYKDYESRLEADASEEKDRNRRAEFAHEGAAWQIGLDYDLGSPTENLPVAGTGTISSVDTVGGAFSWNYFPLRGIDTGRLGVGVRGGAYLAKYNTTNGTVNASGKRKLSALTYGLRATYELQYWVGQLFVPFAFVGYDQVNVKGFDEASTSVSVAAQKYGSVNYGAGLSFNLNRLEPRAASKSLVSTGVRKFYLAYTFQQRSDSQNTGPSHYLGLRFEY
ncbi:MAG: hypothetical protein EOP11_26620 [Proteobacteria bacterium]|nr:MAG: hypothetical protein EOP11_26620 [Pseudomonadota bacterium]